MNIDNRAKLKQYLLGLSADTKPLWGRMTPQQMIEHLATEVQYANGTFSTTCDRSDDEAAKAKARWVYTSERIPKNLAIVDIPEQNAYPGIASAVDHLMQELEVFDRYYQTPGTTAIHPGYGAMDRKEWVLWMSKHFSHHLIQFGLLPDDN